MKRSGVFKFLWLVYGVVLFFIVGVVVKSYVQADVVVWSWTREHRVESWKGAVRYSTDVKRVRLGRLVEYHTPHHFYGEGGDLRSYPARLAYGHGVHEGLWEEVGAMPNVWGWGGLSYCEWENLGGPATSFVTTNLIVPYWMVLGVALLPLGVGVGRRGLRKGVRAGECVGCGYDLRVQRVGERCPECGRVKREVAGVP